MSAAFSLPTPHAYCSIPFCNACIAFNLGLHIPGQASKHVLQGAYVSKPKRAGEKQHVRQLTGAVGHGLVGHRARIPVREMGGYTYPQPSSSRVAFFPGKNSTGTSGQNSAGIKSLSFGHSGRVDATPLEGATVVSRTDSRLSFSCPFFDVKTKGKRRSAFTTTG